MKVSEEVRSFLSKCGRKGGKKKSQKKTDAVRENGKKGGRPKNELPVIKVDLT